MQQKTLPIPLNNETNGLRCLPLIKRHFHFKVLIAKRLKLSDKLRHCLASILPVYSTAHSITDTIQILVKSTVTCCITFQGFY